MFKTKKNVHFNITMDNWYSHIEFRSKTPKRIEPLRKADIRLEHHMASEITIAEACIIPWKEGMYKTPDPSKRKGVA